LHHPGQTGDFGTAEINTLEAVPVGGTGRDLFLEFVGVRHHGNGSIGVKSGVFGASETLESLLGILDAAVTNEPPWGFRGEDAAN